MKYLKMFEQMDFDDAFSNYFEKEFPDIPEFGPKFWEFVKLVDWRDQATGIVIDVLDNEGNRVRSRQAWKHDEEYLLRDVAPHYSWEEMKEFNEDYDRLYIYASDKMESAWLGNDGTEGYDVSDDGYTDLMSSVVGYGLETYLKCIKDDNVAREMSYNNDYHENFGYIFHILDSKEFSREDWDQIYNENQG